MSVTVRVYYDFASPFCYIARAVLARLQLTSAIHVDWQPFEVIDYLPSQGAMPQNPAFVRRAESRQATVRAEEFGLELHVRERLLNSNLALCTVEHARAIEIGGGQVGLTDAVHAALFDAFYREQRDIGSLAVVLEVSRLAGLDAGLHDALTLGSYQEGVAESRRQAHATGVVAVPTFIAGGYGVVGIPAMDAFEHLIKMALTAPLADLPPHPPEG